MLPLSRLTFIRGDLTLTGPCPLFPNRATKKQQIFFKTYCLEAAALSGDYFAYEIIIIS